MINNYNIKTSNKFLNYLSQDEKKNLLKFLWTELPAYSCSLNTRKLMEIVNSNVEKSLKNQGLENYVNELITMENLKFEFNVIHDNIYTTLRKMKKQLKTLPKQDIEVLKDVVEKGVTFMEEFIGCAISAGPILRKHSDIIKNKYNLSDEDMIKVTTMSRVFQIEYLKDHSILGSLKQDTREYNNFKKRIIKKYHLDDETIFKANMAVDFPHGLPKKKLEINKNTNLDNNFLKNPEINAYVKIIFNDNFIEKYSIKLMYPVPIFLVRGYITSNLVENGLLKQGNINVDNVYMQSLVEAFVSYNSVDEITGILSSRLFNNQDIIIGLEELVNNKSNETPILNKEIQKRINSLIERIPKS